LNTGNRRHPVTGSRRHPDVLRFDTRRPRLAPPAGAGGGDRPARVRPTPSRDHDHFEYNDNEARGFENQHSSAVESRSESTRLYEHSPWRYPVRHALMSVRVLVLMTLR
jgi:hypothetical protein